MGSANQARRWRVTGRVQGVGFRFFVQHKAVALGLKGWARNTPEGDVEVYAEGTPDRLDDLASALHIGPSMAEVRSVEQTEAVPERTLGFNIR